MVAVEFGEQRGVDGSYTAKTGCASAVTKAAQKQNMLLLTAGKAGNLCNCGLHYAGSQPPPESVCRHVQ